MRKRSRGSLPTWTVVTVFFRSPATVVVWVPTIWYVCA
jgi:hypothetical protein